MGKKIVSVSIIKSCMDCKHCRAISLICRLTNTDIKYYPDGEIPDWCPLEDELPTFEAVVEEVTDREGWVSGELNFEDKEEA